jgi:hypothetical protein
MWLPTHQKDGQFRSRDSVARTTALLKKSLMIAVDGRNRRHVLPKRRPLGLPDTPGQKKFHFFLHLPVDMMAEIGLFLFFRGVGDPPRAANQIAVKHKS